MGHWIQQLITTGRFKDSRPLVVVRHRQTTKLQRKRNLLGGRDDSYVALSPLLTCIMTP